MAFFGITVCLIIQKLKTKHLVCSQFSLAGDFFEGTRKNILHIFRAIVLDQINKQLNGSIHAWGKF